MMAVVMSMAATMWDLAERPSPAWSLAFFAALLAREQRVLGTLVLE